MVTVKEVLNKKITEYLSAENPFFNKYSIIASTLILLLWLGIVIFTSINHEIWRDEMRALSVALEPSSLFELPTALKNDGHPILWYLLLRIGYSITGSVLTLKVISIIIALMAVILFLWKAPFPIWQKLIFIFGVFPIYEYSVMTRNYGISMLLFFLFAALYQKRKKYPFLIALLLALLANTNIHSTILACLLAGIWFWDDFIDSYSLLTRRDIVSLSLSFVLILTGILLAVLISLPDKKTAINIPVYKDTNLVFQSLMSNIIHPARSFEGILLPSNIFPPVFNDLLLWLLLAGLLVRTKMLIALAAGIVLLGIFFDTAYGGGLRHRGLLLMFIISLY